MSKSIILDEFESAVKCDKCKVKTVHHVQLIDENGDGKYIGYWGECDICKNTSDFPEEDVVGE